MAATYETLIVERAGPVAVVRLNRPDKRNSIGGPMMLELHATLSGIAKDESVRVLVLRGQGG